VLRPWLLALVGMALIGIARHGIKIITENANPAASSLLLGDLISFLVRPATPMHDRIHLAVAIAGAIQFPRFECP